MLKVLSLGAGVQSTAVLLMSCRGLLPKLDAAVFADTGWEPKRVYEHLEWLKGEASGIPIITVRHRKLRDDLITFIRSRTSGKDYTHVPLYIKNPDGSLGMTRRQCTGRYKIEPVDKAIKSMLRERDEETAEVWIGISWDERSRIKKSPVAWKQHVYPLCGPVYGNEMLGKVWLRGDCEDWLKANYPERDVPRSACLGCPYHTNREWRRIREDAGEWADVCEVDEALRRQENPALDGTPYLHASRIPLAIAPLGDDSPQRELEFGMENECEGMCGN